MKIMYAHTKPCDFDRCTSPASADVNVPLDEISKLRALLLRVGLAAEELGISEVTYNNWIDVLERAEEILK